MSDATHFDLARYESAYPAGIQNNYWHLARNRFIDSLIADGASGVLLEIGCGPGIVVDYLRQQGRDCWGCDLGSATPASDAVKPFLLLNRDAFMLDAEFRANVKVLLLLDMLEHLPKPAEFLQQCRFHFPYVELFVITLPARQELWSVYDEHFGHHLRYDLAGTRALLAQSGLQPTALRYFFHAMYLPMRIMALFGVQRSVQNRAPQSFAAKWLHRLVGWGMYLEAKLLPGALPGSSIGAVARTSR